MFCVFVLFFVVVNTEYFCDIRLLLVLQSNNLVALTFSLYHLNGFQTVILTVHFIVRIFYLF